MGLELEVVIVLVGEGILLESFKLNKAQAFSLSCGLLLAIRLLFEFVLFVKAEAAEVAAIFDDILAHSEISLLTAAAAGLLENGFKEK